MYGAVVSRSGSIRAVFAASSTLIVLGCLRVASAQPAGDDPRSSPGPNAGSSASASGSTAPPSSSAASNKPTGPGSNATSGEPNGAPAGETATKDEKPGQQGGGSSYVKGLTEPLKPGQGKFHFGSYGRAMAAWDARGGAGRDADLVARGSRLDENSYVELELRREDNWSKPTDTTPVTTKVVTTMAIFDPLFHYTGKVTANVALRNLYLQERGIGSERLALWVGSRMYRGDDIYLLDFWPLDNLNTVGGGVMYEPLDRTQIALHIGTNRLDNPYQYQAVDRTKPFNQFGTVQVAVLNRPRTLESLRAEHIVPIGEKGGIKFVLYGEAHQLAGGQRESEPNRYEDLPHDSGFVAGAQVGAFTGERDTYVNVFFRHATGLAAYGDFATPYSLNTDRTTSGASETRIAFSGNYEIGRFAFLAGGYFRSFRTASPEPYQYNNVDEGIVVLRPHAYITDRVGIFVEGSYQKQQRGVLDANASKLLTGSLARFAVVPFVSPAGMGSYKRPHLRAIWAMTARDDGARAMYSADDPFARRKTEHFLGLEAEWWFNSSYR